MHPWECGDYFPGMRFIVQAHYPRVGDYQEESFSARSLANEAKDKHVAAGANVQILEHEWIEQKRPAGWYKGERKD